MSTCAITVSFTTAVTIPRSRLRADDSSDRPSGSPALPRTNPASSTPSITRCPCSSRVAASRPASTQRRTVSVLTPSNSAASPIRNTVTERRVPVRIYDVKWPIIFAIASPSTQSSRIYLPDSPIASGDLTLRVGQPADVPAKASPGLAPHFPDPAESAPDGRGPDPTVWHGGGAMTDPHGEPHPNEDAVVLPA